MRRPTHLTPSVACGSCGTDAPNDSVCGDPCCGRCSHPAAPNYDHDPKRAGR